MEIGGGFPLIDCRLKVVEPSLVLSRQIAAILESQEFLPTGLILLVAGYVHSVHPSKSLTVGDCHPNEWENNLIALYAQVEEPPVPFLE